MIEKLMRCTKCDEVIPHPGSFRVFQNSSLLPAVEWSAVDLERQREFFRCHGAHPIEELLVNADTCISDKPSYEPVKVSYFEASNGQQSFLIRRTKPALDQPAFYQLIPGKLLVSNISFNIQEEALRKQMAERNGSAPLTEEKIQKFIRAFQEEVENIGPEKLAEEVEVAEEGETPLLSYGIFKEAHWDNILHRCAQDFDKSDLNKIRKFIDENSQPDDVLSLLVKRKVSIFFPSSGKEDPAL
jgi:hypothetical protein